MARDMSKIKLYGSKDLDNAFSIVRDHILLLLKESKEDKYNIILDLEDGDCISFTANLTTWEQIKCKK